ncbi:la-related protein 6A isoform X1 [Rhododendron vialii]|uniref:la-related protein 6A isoform X1 n=1 Tax=Rhododendron vialii TaxID=182163 RepID=UPI00265D8EC9|nr:la-related protein 6A isoform X1 [Rhododendron vialii]XP_058201201.1 la-related protein 6A isoform X1 [Rhododendron vialii]XP_058201202.1 la-related protein 6A isoform X1 [Rhododendron vialii]
MEQDGVDAAAPTTTTSAVLVAIPPHDPDYSPLGSPEIIDSHLEEVLVVEEEEDHHHSQIASALTDDLRDKIIKQVEYYFSDENLPTDKFLMNYVTQNVQGFVPIAVVASFKKMKKLTQDRSLIVAALKESSFLVVSSNRKKVKRLLPLPVSDVTDAQLCTVLVENLPEDQSTENIQRIFGEAGNIKNICIHDPHAAREPQKRTKAEKLLSGKLHALVEYETVDAAEKAVAMLNNEQDWRYGMRVKLLKRAAKHGQKKKGWREVDFEKNSNVHASDPAGGEENHNLSDHLDERHNEEDGDHLLKEKNDYKAQNRRWGRGQRYRGINGQGHGTVLSSHGSEASKPPPGPRMPDGTRGFSFGRGRTPASNQD